MAGHQTLQEVPKGWVDAKASGCWPGRLLRWRKSGRLVEGIDFCRVVCDHHWGYCYKPQALSREVRRDESEATPYRDRAPWIPPPKGLLRRAAAAKALGVDPSTLDDWTNNGCPFLGGEPLTVEWHPATKSGRLVRHWLQTEIDRIKRRRAKYPSAANGKDVYSFKKTLKLTGLPKKTLMSRKRRERLGLVAVYPRVLGAYRKTIRTNRRICFTKRSVDDFAKNKGEPPILVPPGKMTSIEAAARLDRPHSTVVRWADEGRIVGEKSKAKNEKGKSIWILDRESVDGLDSVLRKGNPPDKMLAIDAAAAIGIHRNQVPKLIKEGILEGAFTEDALVGVGIRKGSYLVDTKSVKALVAEVRRCGDARRAIAQLRRKASGPAVPTDADSEVPRSGASARQGNPPKSNGTFTVHVDDEYDPCGCVRVNGRTVLPLSKATWKLLHVLAEAREQGKGADKATLDNLDSNPLQTLRRFMAKCPPDMPTIQFPGAKGRGGYRLL